MADANKNKTTPHEEDVQPEEEFFEDEVFEEELFEPVDAPEGSLLQEDSGEEHLYDDWDELATDPEEVSRLGRALEGLLPDIVKRGMGGLVSEDGIRSIVTDKGLPREAVGFVIGQADATRKEVVRMVSKEVRHFLENVDLGGELTKILTSVSFEIRTEVRFIPNDAAVKPDVKNKVSVRNRKDGPQKTEEGEEDDAKELPWAEEDLDAADRNEKTRPRRRRWPLSRSRDEDDDEAGDSGEKPPSRSR